jgi:hypothetical protein
MSDSLPISRHHPVSAVREPPQQDAQLSIKFLSERTAHDVRGMGFQPMSGHIIRLYDRIMGWKPMPRRSKVSLLRTRSFQA